MYQFKEGDRVAITEECGTLTPGTHLKVVNNPYKPFSLFVTDGSGICTLTKHWRLISPKERTIEDVEVGDVVEIRKNDFKVVEVLKNSFAIFDEYSGFVWWTFELAKKEVKIKQPEPEKKKTFEDVCDEVINKINKSNDTPLPPYVEHTIRCGFEQLRNILKGNI